MGTKEQLESSLKEAMKSGDDLRKRTLRLALSSIRLAEIEARGSSDKPLEESQVQAILQKEVKSRQESIVDAERANRPDLIEASRQEMSVLEEFLPKQLSSEALEELARQAIADVGATSPKEMGLVMKTLMPRLQGRASGDQASQTVKKLLSG
jgi:hypothetical protein